VQVTHFPLVYYAEFLQLDSDLHEFDKTHTIMTNSERGEPNLDKNYKEDIANWQAAVDWMMRQKGPKEKRAEASVGENAAKGKEVKGRAKGKQAEAGVKKATRRKTQKGLSEPPEPKEMTYRREFWALMPQGCYDWRTHSTHQGRDYRRFAKVALVEQSEVARYRAELFEFSAAALILRRAFQDAMKGLCADRTINFEDSGPQPTNGTWVYADNIPVTLEVEPFKIDIDSLHRERGRVRIDAKHRLEYSRHMAKLNKMGALAAAPDTTDVHPEIAELIKKLDFVSAIL
jgi:hypothetical protein